MKQLFEKHYTNINRIEYMALYNDSLEGYTSMLCDIELEELLNYFADVTLEDIETALYNGTLSFYKYNNNYIAVLES